VANQDAELNVNAAAFDTASCSSRRLAAPYERGRFTDLLTLIWINMDCRRYRKSNTLQSKSEPAVMWRELGRRVAVIVLIVAVATGFAVPATFAGPHHDQTAISVAIGAGHSAGCAHDGCPIDQNAATQGACFSACAGVTVLPAAPATVCRAVVYDILTPSLDLAMVDRSIPPDPYPPKYV
jgi:hypothetical protein